MPIMASAFFLVASPTRKCKVLELILPIGAPGHDVFNSEPCLTRGLNCHPRIAVDALTHPTPFTITERVQLER
jgi:hypothetical protein